ncbi:hypothetical protein G4X40_13185 [Rhodococcus sp. D2-41]|uniref:hypothetical protein n=1 Tax=Speluncibacter jeojiensis TaxID=2710754 RepID=UPI00241049F8|nr:hypothetical protein [Rhodococcus sp. D2-41]MDG3011104.1 hypothetical protein [Rhodococcus sp. D2-41]
MSESRVRGTAETSLGALVVAELREQLLAADESENQAHAKRVLAAYHWSRSIIRTQQLAGVPRERAERLAVSEVAVALTCSTTIATKYIDLGWALVTLLPFTIERSYAEYLSRGNPEPAEPPADPPPSGPPPTTHQPPPDNPLAAALGTPITFGRTCRAPRIPRGSMLFSAGRRLQPVYGDGAIYPQSKQPSPLIPHLRRASAPMVTAVTIRHPTAH